MRIAKADLVPTDANLLDDYAVWAELVDACEAFMDEVNAPGASGHPAATGGDARRGTGPAAPAARRGVHGGVRGDPQGVVVGDDQLRRGHLLGPAHAGRREVWVRVDGDEIVATHVGRGGRGRGRPPPALDAGNATHR